MRFHVSHIYREGNHCVDKLACFGAKQICCLSCLYFYTIRVSCKWLVIKVILERTFTQPISPGINNVNYIQCKLYKSLSIAN